MTMMLLMAPLKSIYGRFFEETAMHACPLKQDCFILADKQVCGMIFVSSANE